MDQWDAIAWLGKRQHQLVTTWQLRLVGLSDAAIAQRLASHGWRRVAPNVLSVGGRLTPLRRLAAVVLSLAPTHDVELRVEAYVEQGTPRHEALFQTAIGAGQAVCGRSALWLHGVGPAPSTPWVRLPGKTAGTTSNRNAVLRFGPHDGTVTYIEGLPVVSVPQSLMDIPGANEHRSKLWLHHDLTALISTADAKRVLTVDQLEVATTKAPRFVGAPALRRALKDLRGELSHSGTERAARRIATEVLQEFGLELHPRPYAIELAGVTVGEADLAVVAIKFDAEIDGPHHRVSPQLEKDRLRDRAVRRGDWEVERFPTELIDLSPRRFAAEFRECVQARIKRFAPT